MFNEGQLVKIINGKFAGAVGQVVAIMTEAIEQSAEVLAEAVTEDTAQPVVTDAPAVVDQVAEAAPAVDAVTVADVAEPATEGKPGQVQVYLSGVVNGIEVHGKYWFNPEDLEAV